MKEKFTSTIAGASIFISLLMILSRGLGFFREMIFANNFGLEKVFDLYLVGAVLPGTINIIILYIGQNFFVPAFQKVNSSGTEDSQKYYNQAFILFIGFGIVLSLILYLLSDAIIDLYMHSASFESKLTAVRIFQIFLLTIPFSAGISVFSALLQTVFEFKYPSISVLFLNLSIIVMLVLFTSTMGIYVIPLGYLIGTILQFTYLLVKSKNYFKLNIIPHLKQFYQLKSVVGTSIILIILIESIGQLYTILDRYFYGSISSGGIASLNYAYIIFVLPISIFSLSLATAVFPKITKAITELSNREMERIYNESISVNILIFMPIAFLFFYFGEPLVKLAFERGKFSAESTQVTYNALKCYSVSIVFYSVYSVLTNILNDKNIIMQFILIIIFVLVYFLNLLLMKHKSLVLFESVLQKLNLNGLVKLT
ncbi:MAG: lipid II flippase MurJ [Ignavibacteriaceae bacterium]